MEWYRVGQYRWNSIIIIIMAEQLIKKTEEGYSNVMPKSWIEAITDKSTGESLTHILQGFNMYFLSYTGNTEQTRCQVPKILRKKGLWITYVKYDGNVYTEWYNSNNIDDKSWSNSSNWRVGNNELVGDLTISANGNWVINGNETEFKAIGEKGNTPLIRIADNKLQVSYDGGDTYNNVSDNPVYTKFRWQSSQNDNIGNIQFSVDDGKTWKNFSSTFVNNLHISRYIGADETLPTSGVAEGTIYAKGPTYAESDTSHNNPIYRLWVYAYKGNTLAWQDNGEFTSIAAGVVQETGSNEKAVMSQKAITHELDTLDSNISNIKDELHGTTQYNITVTFNSLYEYQTIDKITAGTKIKNNTNNGYKLYDKIEGTEVGNLLANSSVVLEADITAIRIMGALEVTPFNAEFTIGETKEGFIEKTNKDIEELSSLFERNSRNKFGIIEYKEGYVISVIDPFIGNIVPIEGFRITNAIPLRNNKGFNVSGVVLNRLHFYDREYQYINSTDVYIGKNLPENACYVVLQFKDSDNTSGYNGLRVDYCEDINNGLLANTWFKIREDVISIYTQEQLSEISRIASAIKALSVNTEGLKLAITNTTILDIILYRDSYVVARLQGEKKTEPEYIEFTQNDITFKAWIDFSMLDGIDTNYHTFIVPILSNKATNSLIYKKDDEKDGFKVNSDFLKETELLEPFTIDGFILLRDGTFHSDYEYRCTDFISVDNILSIKATLPPTNTGAGGAWYDENKVKLPINMSNANDDFWQVVPAGAKYFRVSCPISKPYKIVVLKVDDEHISDVPTYMFKKSTFVSPINSKVVYSYKDFIGEDGNNIGTSRVELTGNGSGEQIKLGFGNRILNHKAAASVSVLDAESIITFGNRDHSLSNADNYVTDIEVRVSGNKMRVYKKGKPDVLCAEKDLTFTLTAGNTYHVGYEKIDFGEINNDKSYGKTTFFIKYKDVEESLTFEYDNMKSYGGVRSDSISGCVGQPYFGIISGHVLFNNFFISSDYAPQAKAVIIGDSFIGCNTLCGTGDMHKKYAALLQEAIGKKDFVIVGKGGEEAGYEFIKFAPKVIDKYKPQYLIIALGVNNSLYESYKSAMEYVINYSVSRGIMPILTTITPFNNDAMKSVRNEVNSWVRNSGYLYVDICKAVTNEEQDSWKSGYVMTDNIHPTIQGHKAIYDAFIEELPELFVQ